MHHFGDYELLHEIARGGMGVVYKARQLSLNRIVAVKMLLFGKLASDEFTKRFRAEPEAAASLQHPNIVAIHEVGEHEGQPYFSMDYVEGTNLAALIKNEALPARRAAGYLRSVAEAIHYAHQRGVLHRDLKPSNLLIDANDQPRVTDFGLAKRLQGDSDLTLTGQVLGTPHYMPPEQAGGKRGEISVASDVYSLGAILYEALVGRPPFLADTLEGVLAHLLHDEPTPPRVLNPGVPRDLETICLRCLNKEPARRYESALALSEELGRWLNHEPIRARPVGPAERLWRWAGRKPAMATLAIAVMLVAAAGLAGILWQWQRAEQHAARETTQRLRTQEALTFLELQRAEDLFEKDEVTLATAYLARIVRQQPANRLAAQRLLSALTQRDFALPLGRLQHSRRVNYVEFSPDGNLIVTASADSTARVWDARTGRPVSVAIRHNQDVLFAQFSPDGKRLVTFANDFRAYLWEATSGHALGKEMPHSQQIHSAQFSPNGRQVLTASEDGAARIWDGQTGEPLLELVHRGPVRSARYSPDGALIVTASEDKTAQVWDTRTGHPAAKPLQHRGRVSRAEFSPNGKWVVTVDRDAATRVWDASSSEPVGKPVRHSEEVDLAMFSPDSEQIITTLRNGTSQLWNPRTWAPLGRPMQHRGWVGSVEFGLEGQRVLTGSGDNTARLWDTGSGEALTPPMQHDGLVWSARLSPDGLFGVTASADKTARIWDVRFGAARSTPMTHRAPVLAAEFSPDGEWVATGSQDKTACLWNSRTGKQLNPWPSQHASWVVVVQFGPDGKQLATGSTDGTARIWDARAGLPLTGPLRHGGVVLHLQFSPDGKRLATASHDTNIVCLWNTQTGQLDGEPMRLQSGVPFVCFSPDGQRLMSGDKENDTAEIRDVASGRLLVEMRGHEGWVIRAAFSTDGKRVVTASEDGTARIWNAQTGQPLTEPLRHKGRVLTARFSSDGRFVATASEDTTAQVWDSRSGQPVGEPLRHRAQVNTVEFSPDDKLVVTASEDGTARLWDAVAGRPTAEVFAHHGTVVSARFSPDGRRVLTASKSGDARVWDVPPAIYSTEDSVKGGEDTGRFGKTGTGPQAILLADLAEAVIGKRVNSQGALESVSTTLDDMQQRLLRLPRDADFTRWLEWFFADRSLRTLSPYSQIRMPDYVWSQANDTNYASWRNALQLCPTNGDAFGQMARYYLRASKTPDSPEAARAEWNSRQAVRFSPWHWYSWYSRREVLKHTGAWPDLVAQAEAMLQAQPDNHYAWNSKGFVLAKNEHWDAAVVAFTRALEIGDKEQRFVTEPRIREEILLNRAAAWRALGRTAEASKDNLAGYQLTARDPEAKASLIDLSAFYNGGAAEEFPNSVRRLAGTDFDFRGWIHLDVQRVRPDTKLPERVNDIPIGRQCRRLHFLHAAGYTQHRSTGPNGVREEYLNVPFGVALGHYIVHYADGQQVDIPILHGSDVRDYWQIKESAPDDPDLVVAWSGSSPHTRKNGATSRLYKSTWENPRPLVLIRTVDFLHADTHAAPILVAITAE